MVGHRHYAGLHICARPGNCLLKVSGKGGDSAAAREGVANERQAAGGSQEYATYVRISNVAIFHGKTLSK
jgi:hypothetical protein